MSESGKEALSNSAVVFPPASLVRLGVTVQVFAAKLGERLRAALLDLAGARVSSHRRLREGSSRQAPRLGDVENRVLPERIAPKSFSPTVQNRERLSAGRRDADRETRELRVEVLGPLAVEGGERPKAPRRELRLRHLSPETKIRVVLLPERSFPPFGTH